jgi:hypothetical protein
MGLKNIQGDSKLKVTATNLAPNQHYTISATNLTNGAVSASRAPSRGGKLTSVLSLDTRGVSKVEVRNSRGSIVKSYVSVGTVEIECCIAKLVTDAINCTCKCDKCKEDLQRAHTIRLLLQAAKYEATLGLEITTQEKYDKAKQLCTEVCACGC